MNETSVLLINTSFAEAHLTLPHVDLIYTDPPYPRDQAIPCFKELAQWAPPLLKRGGSLLTLAPHYLIPEVMIIMADEEIEIPMKYRWIYCMNQERGSHPRMAMGIEVLWKPILHYVNIAYPQGKGFVRDMIHIDRKEKDMHKWQQAEQWVEYYMLKFTDPGDTVLDPYMGTGTVGAVAKRNGRNFIGIDSDPEVFAQAEARICQV